MTVVAIGLNHRSAPLEVLEAMTLSADSIPKALAELTNGEFVSEAVVLSTCNRTEVYVHAERFHDAYREVRDALSVLTGTSKDLFTDHLYVHFHDEAVDHLFTVAAGLDSAVLGEHEILGQIRTANDAAKKEGTSGSVLGPLFEHAIGSGRRVRTDTAIGRRTASISQAAVSLVTDRTGPLDGKHVVLVGAGEVGAGVATALTRSASIELTVTNRTASKAEAIADTLGGNTVPFENLSSMLANADIVISATGAPGAVIAASDVQLADRTNTGRMLILDLAVPRDVDPAVLSLDHVDLLVLGDLQAFANRGLEERQKQAAVARKVVDEDIERYRSAVSAREVAPLLGSMHRWAEGVRSGEIEHYKKHLATLNDVEREAVEALTHAVVAKMLHAPSAQLRDAAGTRRGDRLAEAVRELFDLS